jgi:hypothetical protein
MRAALRRDDRPLSAPPGGRRRPVTTGATLLAVVLLLAGGIAIGRAGSPAEPQVQAGPGPARLVDGVPVGYARSEEGAVAAAVNLNVLLDGEMLAASAPRRIEILDLVAARASRDTLLQQYAQTVAAAPDEGAVAGGTRRVPAGYRVRTHSPREAVVDVWGTWAVTTADGLDPNAAWGTSRIRLLWEQDDWRVASVERVDGPSTGRPPDATAGTDPDDFEELSYGRRP